MDGVAVTPQQPSGADPGRVAPRTTRRRALLTVVAVLTAAGVLVGALWAWIAPAVHAVVAVTRKGERVHEYLGGLDGEPRNFFIAPMLLVSLLGVVAVVAAVAAWQWRDHRGPQMVAALCLGLVGAAAVAAGVGALLVHLRYGALDFDSVPLSKADHSLTYVTQAPPVFFGHSAAHIVVTLLSPTATVALVYAVLAAGTIRDDLGGYPPQHRVHWVAPMPPAGPPPAPKPMTPQGPLT